MAVINSCRPVLEQALGRKLSDQEFDKIEQDFKQASIDAGKLYGKGFSNLNPSTKAKLISDQLNQNRAKSLTQLENQLLANSNITSLSTNANLKSTLGRDIADIDGRELADNINNMISNTLTRTSYLNRGGNTQSFDTIFNTIKNRLGKALYKQDGSRLKELSDNYSLGGLKLDRVKEDALMDKYLSDPNALGDLFSTINDMYKINGLNNKVDKLYISISRDNIVNEFNNGGRNKDVAAAEFEAKVLPLISNGNDVDLKSIYKALLDKSDTLDAGGISRNGGDLVQDLKFKDGASYMSFLRTYGQTKTIVEHIASNLDTVAADIAKKRIFGDEDVLKTIDDKIASLSQGGDNDAIKRLQETRNAYDEIIMGKGRDYNTGLFDLGISVIKNYTSAAFLGRAAIKGFVTDKINTATIQASKGELGDSGGYLVDSLTGLAKDDIDNFYGAMDEFVASLSHFVNTADSSVLSTDMFRRGLERGKRFNKNLAATVQSAQGQNMMLRSNKRSLATIAEKQLFSKNFNPLNSDSLSIATNKLLVDLDLNNLRDLRGLTKDKYNQVTGKNLNDQEFEIVKNDLELEVESGIIHQVQGQQIDSGGIAVQAQNARIFGDRNNFSRRYVVPVLGQFQSYSQNFLLKSQLIRNISLAQNLTSRAMYSGILFSVAILNGYSNYNVGELLKDVGNGDLEDSTYRDPITDIVNLVENPNRKDARFVVSTLLSGSGLPLAKQAELLATEGNAAGIAPVVSLPVSIGNALFEVAIDPTDRDKQAELTKVLLPFNLPVVWDALEYLRDSIRGE